MLTQRKEKRTVEDFNQFCTFVLAYAGYIPYPAEEQWSYLTTRHEDDEEESTSKIKKGQRQAVGKRKCDSRHPTSQSKKKPRKCDSQNTKKLPKFPVSKLIPENNGDGTVEPKHEPAVPSLVNPARSPEHSQGTTRTQSPPWSLPERSSGHYIKTGNDKEELKDVPVDLTLNLGEWGDPEIVSEVTGLLEMEGGEDGKEKEKGDGVEERNQERTQDDCIDGLNMRERTQDDGIDGLNMSERTQDDGIDGLREREREGWTGVAAALQMVMNSRLRGQLPEDQETGYHTDLDGRTPERHSAGLSPSASPAWGSEDVAEENSKLEDDDSWDLITCFCFKPFAGRPMIECNQCSIWLHLSCAKIRRAHVPEVFVCQPCRDSQQPIRRSNRARVPTRKSLSDQ